MIPYQDNLKKIKCSILNFIFGIKEMIKQDTIICKIEDGGVGLVVELRLKAINNHG